MKSIFLTYQISLGIYFSRFRCMNHRLPIECGRFFKIGRAKRTVSYAGLEIWGMDFIISSNAYILINNVIKLFL